MAVTALGLIGVATVAWPTRGSSEIADVVAVGEPTPAAQAVATPPTVAVPTAAPVVQTAPLPAPDTLSTLPVPPPLPPGALPQQILKRVPLPPSPSKTQLPATGKPTVTAPQAPRKPSPPLGSSRTGQPAIEISGTSYSANPSLRMLIANGKVIKEGQELSPGLTLEAIGPRTAVFNQGGTRFNVNY